MGGKASGNEQLNTLPDERWPLNALSMSVHKLIKSNSTNCRGPTHIHTYTHKHTHTHTHILTYALTHMRIYTHTHSPHMLYTSAGLSHRERGREKKESR
jgi:hypothetical protein